MMTNMPILSRGMREGLASVAGLGGVLAALVAVDTRVRDRFWTLLSDASSTGPLPLGERFVEFSEAIVRAASEQSIEHAPLLIFTVVALVLVVFMLRT